MPACPACGSEVPADATDCPKCHLAVHLFDAVREAVGVPASDPRYAAEVTELLKAVDPDWATPPGASSSGPGRLAFPARFPSASAPPGRFPDGPSPPVLEVLPALPALPAGGAAGLRRQLDEYLQLARQHGLDVTDLTERTHEAVSTDDSPSLEVLVREMFVRLAAALSEEYELTVAQRNGLASVISTSAADAELSASRDALSRGDLSGTQRRLRTIHEELSELEEHWATVQILIAECDLLAETIRDLGGDPGPALGPLEEGRRIAQAGGRDDAEPVLARAALALWSVLNPRFSAEMHRIKDRLLQQRAAGEDVAPALAQFRELAKDLGKRNFAATVTSYRRLRELVDPPVPPGVAAPLAPPAAGARSAK